MSVKTSTTWTLSADRWMFGVAMLVASALAGCGGGGDAPPPANYNVAKAWQNLLTATRSWVGNGTDSGGTNYELAYAVAPGPVSVFPRTGTSGPRTDVTVTININGLPQPFFPFLSYGFYDAATFAPFGWQNVTVPSCSTQVAGPALPGAAAIGASGAFYTETEYEDCAPGAAATGTSVVTWSLESDSGYPLFCSNATTRDLANAVVGTGSLCFEVATDGTLGSRFRLTATGEGETLTVRNF